MRGRVRCAPACQAVRHARCAGPRSCRWFTGMPSVHDGRAGGTTPGRVISPALTCGGMAGVSARATGPRVEIHEWQILPPGDGAPVEQAARQRQRKPRAAADRIRCHAHEGHPPLGEAHGR
jgi:hypothetical protein